MGSPHLTQRAMLLSIPAVTEQQTKGKPPVGACQLVIHRGSHHQLIFRPRKAVAFAYAHVTRRGHFGQRTERPQGVDEARRSSK